MRAIEAESLSKKYGATVAVRDVSLEVDRGEIFGFLGPNGAGKTTTIRLLTALLPPSGGSARVLGFDVRQEGKQLRSRIGVVQQGESYESTATVEESLDLYGLLWNLPKPVRKTRIDRLLPAFDLEAYRAKRVSELSLGLRRRLQVTREFLHDMDVLFLDEPTLGLDPVARRRTIELLRANARQGLTIFLTTQLLDEAEALCGRIAIIDRGAIVTVDTPQGLKDRFGGMKTIDVTVAAGDTASFASRLERVDGVSAVTSEAGGLVRVWTPDPGQVFSAILKAAEERGIGLSRVTLQEPSLEQAFINLIRKGGGHP